MKKFSKNSLYGNYIESWLEYHKQFIKSSTYSAYKLMVNNHIKDKLGKYKLKHINNEMLQNFVLYQLSAGRKDGNGGLSQRYVRGIIVVIKLSLKFAFKNNFVKSFDIEIAFPKNNSNDKLTVFSASEITLLNKYLLTNINTKNIGILLSLYTGIRIGELCALKKTDIDMKNKTIKINKTLQRVYIHEGFCKSNSKITVTSPKTKTSIREIPIPIFLCDLINNMDYYDNTYILTGMLKPTEPRTYRAYYERLLKRLNIDFKKFHTLRHTFASQCIELGIDYKTVSEIMGHSNINTTLNLYVHSNFSLKEKAINELFSAYN